MLVFPRKIGEAVLLALGSSVDPRTPIGEVLANPVQIKVDKIRIKNVVLSCDGSLEVQVLRGELLE